MSKTFRIRNYSHADKDQVIRLLRLNTPDYFSPDEEKSFDDYLDEHSINYYVVEQHEQLIGCGGFNLSDDYSRATISWDIIHPDYHRQGVGTELTRFRIRSIMEIKSVKMISVRTSQLTFKFYERFGLQLKEAVKDYWAKGFDMYRMECGIDAVDLKDK